MTSGYYHQMMYDSFRLEKSTGILLTVCFNASSLNPSKQARQKSGSESWPWHPVTLWRNLTLRVVLINHHSTWTTSVTEYNKHFCRTWARGKLYRKWRATKVIVQNPFSFCKMRWQKYCHNNFLIDIQLCHGVLEKKLLNCNSVLWNNNNNKKG